MQNGTGHIVQAIDVSRRYGEGDAAVDALRHVSVEFERDRFTAIMGPSGSGKSTLLHVLAGLDRPTGGRVLIDGSDITELDDAELTKLRRDKLGFIFQFFNLLPVLTAEENLVLPLSIAGRKPDRAWLAQLLETVGLEDRRTHLPSELSGGQQQRVAVARALISRPAVVFADEPTGNLDSKASEDVLRLLRQSVDEFDQTVVMVTHAPEAAVHADRLLTLHDGEIVSDAAPGSTDDVIELMKQIGWEAVPSVALKSLWARKLRALGTTVAVFVGVSLIAGTYVITDTINKAFDEIFHDSLKGTAVVITNKQPVTQETNTSTSFPAGILKEVRAVPGVKLAAGTIFTGGGIFNGDQQVGTQFAPKFISAVLPPQIETLKTVAGH